MPDYLGNIPVPKSAPSGVFPLVPDYPHGRAQAPEVAIHQFGSGNAKIEQRFLLGAGAKRFTVRKARLRETDRIALRDFWEQHYGPYGAFTYNAPNDDGVGTTAYTCRFANEPLSWEMLGAAVCSLGVTLIEIPSSSPTYTLNQTVNRFPPAALQQALLSQVQEIIPLVKIVAKQPGYPAIYVSDRRATIGSQLYQARLLEFDGIAQSIGNEADEAEFTFGNADRVMRDLANDVDLYRAALEFSLFHVATGIKLDLWKGEIIDWSFDAGPEFHVRAADGIYELNLPYPTRRISRTCWKQFKDGAGCPYTGPDTTCDKGFDTPNGCRSHGMDDYFGGILAKPVGVRIKDNSTGTWGFGRSTITSVSLVADSIYDEVVPEIYTDSDMPVNAKIALGREESDFYAAVGIVGEGPLGAYGTGHKLDGQYHHGYPGSLGLMESLGPDPNPTPFGIDTDNPVERAAGTAFVMMRRADAKGLQLSRLSEHAMEVVVAQGLSGWVWTAPGVRSLQVLTNPVWIAINMLLRARGLRFADAATCEQFFDVDAAIAAAQICDEQVTKLVGTGAETQFKFRGVIQEEKPLRDWLQEVLMNSLGYYTFANGKLKLGVRVNSSAVEAFTEGNILFGSLQLGPLKPSFNHLTANFADEDFNFVANSISLYDIDHAALIGGGAGPLFLKSTVNLSGTASKSQAARIITTRLREELGGITPAEWKAAREIAFKTTVLALSTEPGMVCSMAHPDMPGGSGEFRVTSWRLNRDYSIDIQGRTTTDSMYDLLTGPKPADVVPEPVPEEILIDTGVPGVLSGTPKLGDYGTFALDDMSVAPDASGNLNIVGAHEITLALYYVDELAADLWASIDAAVDAATDPLSVPCTVNPATGRQFQVGDFVVFNDEAQDAANPGRRSYECAQITGINANQFTFQRAYAGVPSGQATFGTLRCAHQAGIRFYKLDRKIFTFSVKKGFFRTPGLPARIEAKLPSACIVAAVAGVANHFGYGPFTVFPLSHHNEPFMPGDRTSNGGAYTFQIPGPLAVQENVAIPIKVQDAASIRCIYAYLQQGTTDGQSAYLVKISRDGGATWEPLEFMGIAQSIPMPFKTTYDFLLTQGYGRPETRRLPYNDFGVVLAQAVTAGPNPQTVHTASYGANRLGLEVGEFVHIDLGRADEEYVKVLAVDPDNQTFTAIFTKDHAVGATVRPTIWPTPVLNEGDDLAFDILDVASPDPGSDLTVVIQT